MGPLNESHSTRERKAGAGCAGAEGAPLADAVTVKLDGCKR